MKTTNTLKDFFRALELSVSLESNSLKLEPVCEQEPTADDVRKALEVLSSLAK